MKADLYKGPIFTVQREGLLANRFESDGRFIPLFNLKPSDNRDPLLKIIALQDRMPDGKIKSQWAKRVFNANELYLICTCLEPLEVEFAVRFNVKKEFMRIDAIIQSRGMMLARLDDPSMPVQNLPDPKLLVEVPDTGFDFSWEERLRDAIKAEMEKQNLSRKELTVAIEKYIKQMRRILNTRFQTGKV